MGRNSLSRCGVEVDDEYIYIYIHIWIRIRDIKFGWLNPIGLYFSYILLQTKEERILRSTRDLSMPT